MVNTLEKVRMTRRMIKISTFLVTGERLNARSYCVGKSSLFIIPKSENHHFKSLWSGFTILWMVFTHLRRILFQFFQVIYSFFFKFVFSRNVSSKIWYHHLFLLEYAEGKQQICCQSVFCNTIWVLMHCVENESGLSISNRWYIT